MGWQNNRAKRFCASRRPGWIRVSILEGRVAGQGSDAEPPPATLRVVLALEDTLWRRTLEAHSGGQHGTQVTQRGLGV